MPDIYDELIAMLDTLTEAEAQELAADLFDLVVDVHLRP